MVPHDKFLVERLFNKVSLDQEATSNSPAGCKRDYYIERLAIQPLLSFWPVSISVGVSICGPHRSGVTLHSARLLAFSRDRQEDLIEHLLALGMRKES